MRLGVWILAVAATQVAAARIVRADDDIKIVDKPVNFDDERKQLTIEYRRAHQDPAADSVDIEPKVIVLHYTAGGSFSGTWDYFNATRLETARKTLRQAGEVNVLAQFVVDRDGTIYRIAPETCMGRHTIGLNHVAIGVENVGDGARYPLTNAQVEANAKLVRYLAARHPITHLLAHSEAHLMEGHPYWLELDAKYRNRKPDPGKRFMARVRSKIEDLGLEGPPVRARKR